MDFTLPKPVLTKVDFVRRYQNGEFGNASPTWDSVKDFTKSPEYTTITSRTYHLRNRIAGGITGYDLHPIALIDYYNIYLDRGNKDTFYVSAMAPTHLTLFQGELQQTHVGLELTYSTLKETMRSALLHERKRATGLDTLLLLRKYLCDNSYGWIQDLLKLYPYHVIEFSTYSTNFGTVKGFNTVFWEVRMY